MHNTLKEEIDRKIRYADKSFRLASMYEVYGILKGLRYVDAISSAEYVNYSTKICKEYFNNASWRRECAKNYNL